MLDIKYIREHTEEVKKTIALRGLAVDLEHVLALDKERGQVQQNVDKLRAERNRLAEEVEKVADRPQKESFFAKGKALRQELDALEKQLAITQQSLHQALAVVPNLLQSDVPSGVGEEDDVEIKKSGTVPAFSFPVRDHVTLGEELDLIDIKRAAKVSGSRFGYLKNEAALLEFALIQLAMDTLVKESFTPVVPPVIIKKEITQGLGYMQFGGNEQYYYLHEPQEKQDFYLVGTAEHAIVPMYADETFPANALPKRLVAFSSAFRREAGTYGKDTRGILRVHQFDKVEMVSFVKPEDAEKEHQFLLAMAEKLVGLLGLPYRVMALCAGDLSPVSAKTYDIETWMPGQDRYRETHSISNTLDYQARRLNIRYHDGKEKGFVHILNGTAFAIGRTLIAILENYQQADGSVKVPEILQKYTGFSEIKPK